MVVAVASLAVGCSEDPFEPAVPFMSSAGMSGAEDDETDAGTGGASGDPSDPTDDPSGEVSTGGGSDDEGGDPTGTDPSAGDETGGGEPGCYWEPLDPDAPIDDLVAAYGTGAWKDTLIEAMQRRYPAGAYLLDERRDDPYFDQFSDPFDWAGMVGWLDTLVHEQTHLFNAYHAIDVGEQASLYMREDLVLYLPPGQGFARAEILGDLPPALAASIYADTYLTGDQGARGFNELLDETCAYVNEVPAMASFGEFYPGGVSLRDGTAAMLVFVQTYLRRARTQYPDYYAWAQSQPVYVEAVQLLWQRAHFFFEEVGDAHPNLGISDGEYRAEALRAENLDELRQFTGVDLGAGPCIGD